MPTKKSIKAANDSPQFNYRYPGEPETVMQESKETPGGQRNFPKEGSAPKTKSEQGLSEMAGMSEPKSQIEQDIENAWTTRKRS